MQNQVSSVQSGRNPTRPLPDGPVRLALNEHELAERWGLSVKTLCGEFIDMARRVDGAAGAAAIQAFWVTGAWAAMFVPEGIDRAGS